MFKNQVEYTISKTIINFPFKPCVKPSFVLFHCCCHFQKQLTILDLHDLHECLLLCVTMSFSSPPFEEPTVISQSIHHCPPFSFWLPLPACEKDVKKVCADSSEENLQPFKEKMEGFLSAGESS